METLPKALAFDLDGTLAPSKSHLESDMAEVFAKLLNYLPMAVISGASRGQFDRQFLNYLPSENTKFSNLYIFSENGASLKVYKDDKWIVQYEDKFNEEESRKIIQTLNSIIDKYNLSRDLGFGELIENRGSQITLSSLGQNAPLEIKQKWDSDQIKRSKMREDLLKLIPEFEIRIGGATSIDITKKGENKASAVNKFLKMLDISSKELIFFGDALFLGGNDEIVKETGVICRNVNNPQDTIKDLRDIINSYEKTY